jgi:hypothetical protein
MTFNYCRADFYLDIVERKGSAPSAVKGITNLVIFSNL